MEHDCEVAQRGCATPPWRKDLQDSKANLDAVLGSLLWVSLLEQELDQVDREEK